MIRAARFAPQFALALLVLISSPRGARADEAVVLVVPTTEASDGLAPAELADALDLVLGDLGIRVRLGPAIAAPSLERAMSSATAIGRAGGALAIVWTTARSGGRGLVAHVLDLRAGRAIAQALRVDAAAGGEDLSRVVALKVRALLQLALADRTNESAAVRDLVAPLARSAAPPSVLRAGLGWQLALGASEVRHGPSASIAVALPFMLEATGRLSFMGMPDVEVATGTVETTEIEIALEVRRIVPGPRGLSFAIGPTGRVHAIRSTGVTNDGRQGSVRAAMPEVGLGAAAAWSLGHAVALQLDVSGGAMLGRRRMLLSGTEAFDLGRFGATARISLVIPGR